MDIKQIKTPRCQGKIKEIYENSFPENERVDFVTLFDKGVFPQYEMYGFYENKEAIGFAYLLVEEELNLAFLGYIAVKDGLRDVGKGSKMINFLKEKYNNKCIAVNIESSTVKCDNKKERLMRENFYYKNGFKYTGIQFKNRGETFNSYYYGDFDKEKYIKLMHSYFPDLTDMKTN